jgi:hypothetical protein
MCELYEHMVKPSPKVYAYIGIDYRDLRNLVRKYAVLFIFLNFFLILFRNSMSMSLFNLRKEVVDG